MDTQQGRDPGERELRSAGTRGQAPHGGCLGHPHGQDTHQGRVLSGTMHPWRG